MNRFGCTVEKVREYKTLEEKRNYLKENQELPEN
jgi:hypothetical protein